MNRQAFQEAATWIGKSDYTTAFTGAGISVESGIPPFRGPEGLWSRYDPTVLDIGYFHQHPEKSWAVIKEIFYDFFGKAKPNAAHFALAHLEEKGLLKSIITQNIDNLHQEAGSLEIIEFHGTSHSLVCTRCEKYFGIENVSMDNLPVKCNVCGGLVKPDFIFFGEGIPHQAYEKSLEAARRADVFLVIGTTGEIMPASQIPFLAKENGAKIIEVNTEPSKFTHQITDIFLQGKATEVLQKLMDALEPG
jgi:NAD-dependent deacetylase